MLTAEPVRATARRIETRTRDEIRAEWAAVVLWFGALLLAGGTALAFRSFAALVLSAIPYFLALALGYTLLRPPHWPRLRGRDIAEGAFWFLL